MCRRRQLPLGDGGDHYDRCVISDACETESSLRLLCLLPITNGQSVRNSTFYRLPKGKRINIFIYGSARKWTIFITVNAARYVDNNLAIISS